MKKFIESNAWQYRLARTIAQGIIGVLITYLGDIIGLFNFDATMASIVTALVMAVLSPIMAALKKSNAEEE